MTSTVFITLCDHCAENIENTGYLLQEKDGLKPQRKLLCTECKESYKHLDDYEVVMTWTNFRIVL